MAYKAFVSSTYEDLKEHRKHVTQALQAAGVHVDPMEKWTAASIAPKKFSLDRVKDCDLCVLLVAFRRGHVPKGETLSITQMEYRFAVEHGIDVLPFLLDDTSMWWPDFDERKEDQALLDWRTEIVENYGVGFFNHKPSSVEIAPAFSRWLAARSTTEEAAPDKRAFKLKLWKPPDYPKRPYPLLRPYEHPKLFAGRNRELEALEDLLADRVPITSLYSTSGAGKSSLLRAGLQPRLREKGHAVAYESYPRDAGLAARLVGQMLTFSYDVPVKLFSFHLLLMAIILFSLDGRRLLNRSSSIDRCRLPMSPRFSPAESCKALPWRPRRF